MSEEVTYDSYIEVQPDGSCLAQLLDLPGCFGRGTDEARALAALMAAIPDYYAWLRRHDDYTPDVAGPFAVTPKQVERVQMVNGRVVGAFFAAEDEPVTSEDLDWPLALLDWAYSDLYALLAALSTSELERPGLDGLTPSARAERTAQEQLWLISRIEPRPTMPRIEQLPGTALDRLRQVWRASIQRLRNTSDEERQRILEQDGERWSLRKVLRRSVLHARIQLASAGHIARTT
jgi:predicted RNase H-like HicB family nuclease